MNLTADICLRKMAAGLLSHPIFVLPKIIGILLFFITKIPGGTLLTKMPAELTSTEQIFTETSCLVPLLLRTSTAISRKVVGKKRKVHATILKGCLGYNKYSFH